MGWGSRAGAAFAPLHQLRRAPMRWTHSTFASRAGRVSRLMLGSSARASCISFQACFHSRADWQASRIQSASEQRRGSASNTSTFWILGRARCLHESSQWLYWRIVGYWSRLELLVLLRIKWAATKTPEPSLVWRAYLSEGLASCSPRWGSPVASIAFERRRRSRDGSD